MKTAILIACLFINHGTSAEVSPLGQSIIRQQANTFFTFLRGHKQGHGYGLQWNMNSNMGIVRFEVQYTYEDASDPYSNWYTAGMVNNSNAQIFKFTDMGAIPGIINYRVIAFMNYSQMVVSEIYTCTIGE